MAKSNGVIDLTSSPTTQGVVIDLTTEQSPFFSKSSPARSCPICFEEFSTKSSRRKKERIEISEYVLQQCGHSLCFDCLRSLVNHAVTDHKMPVTCVVEECSSYVLPLAAKDVIGPTTFESFSLLMAEYSLDSLGTPAVYCPYNECSGRVLVSEDLTKSYCPHCSKPICVKCNVVAWHENLSCKEFQALPESERSCKDVAKTLALASKQNWRRCPSCHMLVERREGCNYIKCNCGERFCYNCGVRYLPINSSSSSSKDRRENYGHGKAGCNCGIWINTTAATAAAAAGPAIRRNNEQARPAARPRAVMPANRRNEENPPRVQRNAQKRRAKSENLMQRIGSKRPASPSAARRIALAPPAAVQKQQRLAKKQRRSSGSNKNIMNR